MGGANTREYRLALEGEAVLRAHLLTEREGLLAASIDGFIEEMSSLLPEVDRAVLTDDFGEDVISDVQEALRTGVDGWVDDALAFIKPWGFDLDEITIPTAVWHGSEDRFNPVAHGQWLAAHVPGASSHFLDGAGHLSTWQASPTMLDEMLARTHP
jgi:pimeloyl-ACP methyl ester carboxylesterase